jgi:hypothetical protein
VGKFLLCDVASCRQGLLASCHVRLMLVAEWTLGKRFVCQESEEIGCGESDPSLTKVRLFILLGFRETSLIQRGG